jgi:hypothetical protein
MALEPSSLVDCRRLVKRRQEEAAQIQCVSCPSQRRTHLIIFPDTVFSQPADTGVGMHRSTQLVYALDWLKVCCAACLRVTFADASFQNQSGPKRLDDIAAYSQVPLDTDRELLERFKEHERVEYDPKMQLYSYKVRGNLPLPASR